MAIKGTGFNDANIRNQTIASGDTLEIDGDVTVAEGVVVTAGGVEVTDGGLTVTAGGASITGNSSVTGNLTVTGTLISQDEQQTLVKDNFLDLNFGYTGTSYEQSGLTFNYQATADGASVIDTTVNNVVFTAGTTTLRAKFTISDTIIGGAVFSENDLIQISGTTSAENDGIYVVHSSAAAGGTTTIEVKSSSLTSPDEPDAKFALLDFTSETESTVTNLAITGLTVMALRASSTGTLQSATGTSDTSFTTYTDVGAGSVSLQTAYNNGATITTASSTDIAYTLTSGDFTVDSGSINFGGSTPLTSFEATASAQTLTASAAATEALIIDASNAAGSVAIQNQSGTVAEFLDASVVLFDRLNGGNAGAVRRVPTAAGDDFTIQLEGATSLDASLQIESNGSASDALIIQTVTNGGGIDINSVAGVTIDAASASNFTVDGAGLTVQTTTSGTLTLTSAAVLDINGQATTLDATTLSIDSVDTTNFTMSASDGDNKTMTISATNAGAGRGDMDITVDDRLEITATERVDVTTTNDRIRLDSGATLDVRSDDVLTIQMDADDDSPKSILIQANNTNAGGSAEGNIDLDADNNIVFQITGTGVASFSTAGLTLDGAGSSVDTILDEDDMSSDSDTALATQQSIKAYVDSVSGASIELEAAVNLLAGEVIAIATTGGDAGKAIKADADSADTCQVIGIAEANANATETVTILTTGNLTGFTGLTAGSKLYASTTAGEVTSTPPSGSGDVIFQIGYARSATEVIIVPQYVMELG